ncbi:MAG: hypothetical protein JO142_18650 [Burkholderiales bacterium]|nr:hypothetical protein [Burkholderiales bacterium]
MVAPESPLALVAAFHAATLALRDVVRQEDWGRFTRALTEQNAWAEKLPAALANWQAANDAELETLRRLLEEAEAAHAEALMRADALRNQLHATVSELTSTQQNVGRLARAYR